MMLRAQEVRVTVPGIGSSRYALSEHVRLGPDVDVVGVLLGDVDEDPDDVGAVDHVDRRGLPAGDRSGARGMAVGSPVAGQDEVARCWRCGPRSRRRRAR